MRVAVFLLFRLRNQSSARLYDLYEITEHEIGRDLVNQQFIHSFINSFIHQFIHSSNHLSNNLVHSVDHAWAPVLPAYDVMIAKAVHCLEATNHMEK